MDRFDVSTLRSYYGALLTEKQNDIVRLRYDEDLSLGEIAELCAISRQAVADSVSKGEKALEEYDAKLKLIERDKAIRAAVDKISAGETTVTEGLELIKRILEE